MKRIMINSEQQELLNTNPFSSNYGTTDSHQPKPKKTSCSFYTLQIIYITTTILIIVGFLFINVFKKFQEEFITATLISVGISCLYSCSKLTYFGTPHQQNRQFKRTNKQYKKQKTDLEKTKNELQTQNTDLENEIEVHKQKQNELQEQQKQYEHIITELEKITESKEDIMNLVDDSNNILSRMRILIDMNQRAYLLRKFYQVLPKGTPEYVRKTTVMNEKTYKQFLQMITEAWRNKFEELGNNLKEIWDCEQINVNQFLLKYDTIAGIAYDLTVMEFHQTYETISRESSDDMPQDIYSDNDTDDKQPDIIKVIKRPPLSKTLTVHTSQEGDIKEGLNIQQKSEGIFGNVPSDIILQINNTSNEET
eukprot:278249_1